jgi:4-hydroxybenzoate polyprenyltransferase
VLVVVSPPAAGLAPSVQDVRLLLRTKPWLHPRAYGVWLAISVVAYGTTYFSDPYVFGFTFLGVGTLSFGITLVGVLGAIIGFITDRSEKSDSGILFTISILIGMTSLVAFHVVRGFRWN